MISFLLIFSTVFGANERLEKIFEGKTDIEDISEIRDPFLKPPKEEGNVDLSKRNSGIWDYEEKLTDKVNVNELEVTGVLIGPTRRVLIKPKKSSSKTYRFEEGESVGTNGPVVKAILPGGVILAERINNIYGEPEFIETVVPISK